MPTPYGIRGGLAFGVEELRVLRRALALALTPRPAPAEDVRDCLRLAESLDEAARESARQRAFLLADLARYRAALPGTATGYLRLLGEALDAGHRPTGDDLAALGALRGTPAAAVLRERCRALTGATVPAARSRTRLRVLPAPPEAADRPDGKPAPAPRPAPATPKRPVPTPGEVFPRRKPAPEPAPQPAPPPGAPGQHLAVG